MNNQLNIHNTSYLSQFSLHPDLYDLIWIGDGDEKNYEHESKTYKTEYFTIRFSYRRSEPSSIYTNLNISEPLNSSNLGNLGYYPSYSGMSEQQRWRYLHFLNDPYSSDIDIGYVFVLYYGLERHLLKGDYQKAFGVILKLRRFHIHSSFISYSTGALIISSVIHDRKDNIKVLLSEVIDRNHHIHPSMYMIMKAIIHERVHADEVMKFYKKFELSNTHYIRKYPELFSNELKKLLDSEPEIKQYPHNYISDNSPMDLVLVFANISFETRDIRLPDLFKIEKFIAFGNSLLQRTNILIKQKLQDERSSKNK
jgi:hypothetical protein